MFRDADRAHAGAAAAVGDAEGFVQIQVTDIGADVAGRGESDLRVHVGPVHVNLTAIVVNRGADVFDRCFENTVGGWVSDHQRGENIAVRFSFGFEIGDIDVAVFIAGHGHDFEPTHRRAGRIGAVGAGGNEANVPGVIATRFVVSTDREESRVFALRTRVGLERDGGKSRDLAEPGFEIGEEFLVTARLFGRSEGMQLTELGPRHGKHLAGGIELHRARAERDH